MFNYRLGSSAWLRHAAPNAANHIFSHIAAFLCHKLCWSLISHDATLHLSPTGYCKGDNMDPQTPQTPTSHLQTFLPISRVPCLHWSWINVTSRIDRQSHSVTLLMQLLPQLQSCPQPWVYTAAAALAYWSSFRYCIEGPLLIIHLLSCNFIFFLVHYIVTGSSYGGNLVNRHFSFCLLYNAVLTYMPRL